MLPNIDPRDYEKALSEYFLYEFQPPLFEVLHDIKIKGRYSGWPRQIDVAIRRVGEAHPFLIVEAKRRRRKVTVEYLDAFITKLQDIDAKVGIMVASSDFSEPGKRLAKAFNIELFVMPIEQAQEMNWRPIVRDIYPMDWAFHPEMAAALYRLEKGALPDDVIEAIDDISFEEWLALTQYALSNHQAEAVNVLRFVAYHHYDDGWRFNAIQQLIEFGLLEHLDISWILSNERDIEILDLLENEILLNKLSIEGSNNN
jgi:hypothetical protein